MFMLLVCLDIVWFFTLAAWVIVSLIEENQTINKISFVTDLPAYSEVYG